MRVSAVGLSARPTCEPSYMVFVVAESEDDEPVFVIFPRASTAACGGWEWDEVAVIRSEIEGYGLMVVEDGTFDWDELDWPAYIPLLGRETELHSKQDADIFAKILKGDFVAFPFCEIAPAPAGSTWQTDGLYVELLSIHDMTRMDSSRSLDAGERIVQVLLSSTSTSQEQKDRRECVYILQAAAIELLHIPSHVFSVLAAHNQLAHVDRHFATHVASYRRRGPPATHMLINAHPHFADAAYAAGCINEPSSGQQPTMEMRVARLRVTPKFRGVAQSGYAQWLAFSAEHPELLHDQIYFVTLKESYADGDELTACCAPARSNAASQLYH